MLCFTKVFLRKTNNNTQGIHSSLIFLLWWQSSRTTLSRALRRPWPQPFLQQILGRYTECKVGMRHLQGAGADLYKGCKVYKLSFFWRGLGTAPCDSHKSLFRAECAKKKASQATFLQTFWQMSSASASSISSTGISTILCTSGSAQ